MKNFARLGKLLSALTALVALTALFAGCNDERNDPEFCFNCGAICVERGTPREVSAGVGWFARGARMGHAPSQRTLGYLLVTGQGTRQDVDSGVTWLKLAANQGDAPAQEFLSEICGAPAPAAYGNPFNPRNVAQPIPDPTSAPAVSYGNPFDPRNVAQPIPDPTPTNYVFPSGY